MDHCTFVSAKAEQVDWRTEVKKRKGKPQVIVPLMLSMFTADWFTNHTALPRVLSVFTADGLTEVQSEENASDLENVLTQNPKRVLFVEPAVWQL